jgi:hypothetical protein
MYRSVSPNTFPHRRNSPRPYALDGQDDLWVSRIKRFLEDVGRLGQRSTVPRSRSSGSQAGSSAYAWKPSIRRLPERMKANFTMRGGSSRRAIAFTFCEYSNSMGRMIVYAARRPSRHPESSCRTVSASKSDNTSRCSPAASSPRTARPSTSTSSRAPAGGPGKCSDTTSSARRT